MLHLKSFMRYSNILFLFRYLSGLFNTSTPTIRACRVVKDQEIPRRSGREATSSR